MRSIIKAIKVIPKSIKPRTPTILMTKPTIPKTITVELTKYGIVFKARTMTSMLAKKLKYSKLLA